MGCILRMSQDNPMISIKDGLEVINLSFGINPFKKDVDTKFHSMSNVTPSLFSNTPKIICNVKSVQTTGFSPE